MRKNIFRASLLKWGLAASILLLASAASFGQSVSLTAAPTQAALPDGQSVPMWGLFCAPLSNSDPSAGPTCTNLRGEAQSASTWQPPLIRVQTGATLTINLTNSLPAGVRTSLVIVGQLGGGLGSERAMTPSPAHTVQGTTWPVQGDTSDPTAVFIPPQPQPDRVRSFATEVSTTGTNPATALIWSNLTAGTYLIHSGTHPSIQHPMGLYGVLVVSDSATQAYPGVLYDKDVPLLFSEIDALQNRAVSDAVATPGFSETAIITLRSSVSSVSLALDGGGNPIGGTDYCVGDTVNILAGGGTGALAHVSMVGANGAITEITLDSSGQGFSSVPGVSVSRTVPPTDLTCTTRSATLIPQDATVVAALSLSPGQMCSDGAPACYPPAVNYSPLYYLINGVSFDRTNPTASTYSGPDPASAAAAANVLLRFVNAGLRMHVPSVVGLTMRLMAEDGNPLPGKPKVQTQVFLAAGKTYDVTVQPPTIPGATTNDPATYAPATYAVYDRQLSLSTNNQRDGGMQAYVQIAGGAVVTPLAPVARPDSYFLVGGNTLVVDDPSKGVIANDTGVYGVQVKTLPLGGSLALNADGTFTYNGSNSINSVAVTNGGTGFASAPAVSLTGAGGSGTGAVAVANVTNVVSAITVAGGTCYAATDTVMISGGGGTGATATITGITPDSGCIADPFNLGTINGIVVGAGGSGFTSVPGVTINTTTGDGSAIATAAIDGVVANITLISGGSGYTNPVAVGFVGGGGAGAIATATANTGSTTSDSFVYQANGNPSIFATVTLGACGTGCLSGGPTANPDSYTSTIATRLQVSPPGLLLNDTDPYGLPLKVDLTSITAPSGVILNVNEDGSLTASTTNPGTYTFTYKAKNSQNTPSSVAAMVTLTFPTPTGLNVMVKDVKNGMVITDYRWIIEEDRTFYVNPSAVNNGTTTVPTLGANFHTSHMPVVAAGCIGAVSCENGQTLLGAAAACDIGNGACRTDVGQKAEINPNQVHLDPAKRYYISVLPGDGSNPVVNGSGGPVPVDPMNPDGPQRQFEIAKDCPDSSYFAVGTGLCGHTMGGAPIATGQTGVTIGLQQTPLTTAKIAVFVFQDDAPLNGENDAGGGVDVLAPNEPGLGGFELKLFDQAGGFGDSTGQLTYDMFNMPVSNALAGTIDPVTGQDACPITKKTDGLVGMIPTCPKYEADGVTLSPLAGQALIANLYPGLYEVVATPAADRIARGEEWLQTNTLDGTKPHEAFIKPGEPGYFQEFGPGGFHVAIGFANPAIINARKAAVCATQPCSSTLNGQVTNARFSRTPDQRIYSSGGYDAFSFTQCYVSIGAPDQADFAFTKCNPDGTFTFSNMPKGDFKLTVFDQWNEIVVDGLSTAVKVDGSLVNIVVPVTQWRTNIYTRTFLDVGDGTPGSAGDGVSQPNEPGLPLVSTNIRYRDGSFGFFNNTDLNGYAGFNEVFPFFNWLVIETDTTRYKQTGAHVVYDAGGPADCDLVNQPTCIPGGGNSSIAAGLANTIESPTAHVPSILRTPGARYCLSADCPPDDAGFDPASGNLGSTGRVDPPWATTFGWQGMLGQSSFIEWGMKPFASGENGGIKGHVIYASTRPFDDPSLSLQLSWEPGVPNVTINLYQEGVAADGTKSLKLVDTTTTTSWDDWAQGFHLGADSTMIPNMSCPGQETGSPFYFTLENSRQWLNPGTPIPENGRFKCFDGWSMLNQVQPAPYDGMYQFPSVTARDPVTGKPTSTNCTACVPNPDGTDPYRTGVPMLPAGKYVVEVIVPPGFELVKEEDKNILLGDTYIAPVTQQFAGLGNIFIMPDQAAINRFYNSNNALNRTTNLGAFPHHEGDTGSVETFWPCVGATRIVPDFMSLFPHSGQNSPFAGASRPLCDRKEVTLSPEMTALAKFFIFSSTHVAGHFTGSVTNDFASEFDPFSPQFGEKFGVVNIPIAFKDFAGNEVMRVYSDQWGLYNGLNFSSYAVNPPNPTGYIPMMMLACMNDPGPIPDPAHPGQMITDPMFNPAYSNFCYETPFMPGQTQYMDTPVLPVMAFADGYNLPDCEYPDTTPAIKQVNGDGIGPWVSGSNGTRSVSTLTVINRGSGFTGVPNVVFASGATEFSASATAKMQVSAVSVSAGGGGYTSVPSVGFVGGGGSGAAGTATVGVTSINVTNPGRGYTSNDLNGIGAGAGVSFTGGTGTGAAVLAANVSLKVVDVIVNAVGTCTGVRNIAFSGVGGAVATKAANGTVTVTNGGNYTSVPTASIGGCTGESLTAVMGIRAITLATSGSYTSAPSVNIVAPPSVSGNITATASALLGVASVAVTSNGTGYTSLPAVTFTGGGGTGAAASATLRLDTLTLISGGSYTNATNPTATFTGAGGTGATATAALGAAATHTLTITALGAKQVVNNAYSGPQATSAPFNQKFLTRNYSFGATQGTGAVTIGGVNAPVVSGGWTDSQITVNVPSGVPSCSANGPLQRTGVGNATYSAECGELVITTANGKKSIDTVTVTIGGKPPTHVPADKPTIQAAIDDATSGDLIIVAPGSYKEMLLMWKPVRLQGTGANSVTINADAHPAGVLDPWRKKVNCVFGLTPDGRPNSGAYDGCPDSMLQKVDRIPFEGVVGWDTTTNGNLAQLLQEPTLMGAYEGAGITVLGRGVRLVGSTDFFGIDVGEQGFPAGSLYLTNSNADCTIPANPAPGLDYATSNFLCNPSRIDGLSVTNSSQGGGGIFVHGWNHNLEIANTRIFANTGTLSGGITIGTGEFPDPYIYNAEVVDGTVPLPFTAPAGTVLGQQLGYGFNKSVKVHHNSVTGNASIGDELYSGTPSAAGGVTFCSGADNYKFNFNWVCGNLGTGDGGGVVHAGFIENGNISNNSIMFNQSANPTIPTHGGGLAVLGAGADRTLPDGTECGATTDVDCPVGISEGAGPGLVIDSNLIMGNSAESGSGGGLRLQNINGSEVAAFPNGPNPITTGPVANRSPGWYEVTVTNNIITNNVAGWDGGGVSMQDALRVNFVNNTVMSNDTTGSAGVLFHTLGSVMASTTPPGCDPVTGLGCTNPNATSVNQPAGLVTMRHTPNLIASLPATISCPVSTVTAANPYTGTGANATCRFVSLPVLANNVFWNNRAFHVGITGQGTGLISQQNLVALFPILNQATTGACPTTGVADPAVPGSGTTTFWDIGVRGDSSATPNSGSGFTLSPRYSILTNAAAYSSGNNLGANPTVVSQYCNGSRLPPENGGHGYNVPPGRSETVGLSDVFVMNNIKVAATVDEGNNWINLSYGPLSMFNPAGATLGQYFPVAASPSVDAVPNVAGSTYALAPATDFNGNSRKIGSCSSAVDMGAVEFQGTGVQFSVSPLSLAFGNDAVGGTASTTQFVTVTNCGTSSVTLNSPVFSAGFHRSTASGQAGTCGAGATFSVATNCTIGVQFDPTSGSGGAIVYNGTLTLTSTNATANATRTVALTGNAGPTDSVSPSLLEFGNQAVGTTSTSSSSFQTTLTNSGIAAMRVDSLTFSAGFARGTGGTQCATTLPFTLAAGASCNIRVVFGPTIATGGAIYYSGTLTIGATDTASVPATPMPPLTVALTGTGTAPIAGVNPTSLDFGNQPDGSTSAFKTVTLFNTGLAPLTLTSNISVIGTDSTQFATSNNTCGNSGATLAAGANCTIRVTFTPTSAGSKTATLRFLTNDPVNGTLTVSLTGTGVVMGVTPASLTFADRVENTGASASQTLTVRNATGGTRSLAVAVTAPFSRLGGNCATTLANNTNCTITVVFTPTAIGPATGSVTITTNGSFTVANSPVGLSGNGIAGAIPSVSTTPAFGIQLVGTTSATHTITVSNASSATASANLVITSIALGGANPTQYSLLNTGTCSTTSSVAVGASCTIDVAFSPTSGGSKPASVVVGFGAPASSTSATVTLSGSGAAASVQFASASLGTINGAGTTLAFGNLSGAQSSTVTITNANGSAGVTLGTVAVTNGTGTAFSKGADGCSGQALAAGQSCTVVVLFAAPTNNSSRTGTLSVPFTGGTGSSPRNLNLTGS